LVGDLKESIIKGRTLTEKWFERYATPAIIESNGRKISRELNKITGTAISTSSIPTIFPLIGSDLSVAAGDAFLDNLTLSSANMVNKETLRDVGSLLLLKTTITNGFRICVVTCDSNFENRKIYQNQSRRAIITVTGLTDAINDKNENIGLFLYTSNATVSTQAGIIEFYPAIDSSALALALSN